METSARQYQIVEELGRGGFGTVYRAAMVGSAGFSKEVAIKVLNKNSDMPHEMLLRLRDEARILGAVRHRAIVGVDSLTELDVGWAVIMEYVPGVDVAQLLKLGPFPVRSALGVVEDVAGALHAAWHAIPTGSTEPLRLVHRDIKPANIRVTPDGQVKLLDFGVARAQLQHREAHTRSLAFGSIHYMSPERFIGEDSPASDIYALGLVLCEMITGEKVPESPRRTDWHATFVLERLTTLRKALSAPEQQTIGPELLTLIKQMLSFDPELRPKANHVEHVVRTLQDRMSGATLRAWADGVVNVAMRSQPIATPSSSILIERSSGINKLNKSNKPHVPLTYILTGVGISALGLLGLLVIGIVFWSKSPPIPTLTTTAPPVVPLNPIASAPVEPTPVVPTPVVPEPTITNQTPSTVKTAEKVKTSDTTVKPVVPVQETKSSIPTPAEPTKTARITATGASSVWLTHNGLRVEMGAVEPGNYTVMAVFSGGEAQPAGKLTVSAGQNIKLTCNADWGSCK